MGKQWKQCQTFIFGGSKITADSDCSHEIKRHLLPRRKPMTNLDGILKSRDITLQVKVHVVKAMFFPIIMYGCETWTIKKAEHQRTDAFKLWCWKSPLDYKEFKPVHPKGNQPWIFIVRSGDETEASILWLHDAKNWIIGKNPNGRKDLGQEEKGATEDEMVEWHHWLNGHEFEQTQGDSEGHGSLVCCSSRGCRVGHDLATKQHYHQLSRSCFVLLTSISEWKSLRHVRLFVTPWTVLGILQARILEWVAFPFSRGSSHPEIETRSPTLQAYSLTTELSGKPTANINSYTLIS